MGLRNWTYVLTQMPDLGDQGVLLALVDAAPGDSELVRGEIQAVAKRLAAGDISQTALDHARGPLLADLRQKAKTNAWWAEALSAERDEPGVVQEARTTVDLVGSITLEDVRRAAATWLDRPPLEMTAVPAGS